MLDIHDNLLHEGASVDIAFGAVRPSFGDLFEICGDAHPHFPPTGQTDFKTVADLQFTQVDDYFGVLSLADDGADVVVWLFPLVDGQPVHHHPGPFDGLRLGYSVLRNPVRHAAHFIRCIEELSRFGIGVRYNSRQLELGVPPDLSALQCDIDAVVQHWAAEGIVVGSNDALELDF